MHMPGCPHSQYVGDELVSLLGTWSVEPFHFFALLGGNGGVERVRNKLRLVKSGEIAQGRHILVNLLVDSHGPGFTCGGEPVQ